MGKSSQDEHRPKDGGNGAGLPAVSEYWRVQNTYTSTIPDPHVDSLICRFYWGGEGVGKGGGGQLLAYF